MTAWTRRLRPRRRAVPSPALAPVKCRAIDAGFQRQGVRRFADLGGVWAVDAGYTFYALDRYSVDRAVLVDTGISDAVRARARHYPQLECVDGEFGDPEVVARVGRVDAVILFDVLLHQVDPHWDRIVEIYAALTDCLVVVNPQFTVSDHSVRLLDLGPERYLANVPPEQGPIDFAALDEPHPTYGRPWRDIHEIWQWGITDEDLHEVASRLGFELVFFEDAGRWRSLENFRNRAFVYVRT